MNKSMRIEINALAAVVVAVLLAPVNAFSKNAADPNDPRNAFLSEIPDYPGNVILGRPTDHSITASVMWNTGTTARIEYKTETAPPKQTAPFALAAGEPQAVLLANLEANAIYRYRIVAAASGQPLLPATGAYSFHTARPTGSPFVFTVQSDSHLDGNTRPDYYVASISNACAAKPDFHLDLGDTFMADKFPDRAMALRQYLAQHYYFGLIGHAAPVFLALGNHDGEGTAAGNDLSEWACGHRVKYFPNPVPDAFYSGNADQQPASGPRQNYYSWTWGDALFVVLDPYSYCLPQRGGDDPWTKSLGKTQYDWLAQTLRTSKAQYKFVFIHQMIGGLDKFGRGGVKAAPFYEWGGHDPDGSDTFAQHRPGWAEPIHRLLVETGVTVVFHGHDHFYAREELDGVVYQLLPQPAFRNFAKDRAHEFGYEQGQYLSGSGNLRVRVGPEQVTIDYILATGETAGSYTLPAPVR